MSAKPLPEWEVRISVFRNGMKVHFSDALGDYPDEALYFAHNDLELWASNQEESRGNWEDDDD